MSTVLSALGRRASRPPAGTARIERALTPESLPFGFPAHPHDVDVGAVQPTPAPQPAQHRPAPEPGTTSGIDTAPVPAAPALAAASPRGGPSHTPRATVAPAEEANPPMRQAVVPKSEAPVPAQPAPRPTTLAGRQPPVSQQAGAQAVPPPVADTRPPAPPDSPPPLGRAPMSETAPSAPATRNTPERPRPPVPTPPSRPGSAPPEPTPRPPRAPSAVSAPRMAMLPSATAPVGATPPRTVEVRIGRVEIAPAPLATNSTPGASPSAPPARHDPFANDGAARAWTDRSGHWA